MDPKDWEPFGKPPEVGSFGKPPQIHHKVESSVASLLEVGLALKTFDEKRVTPLLDAMRELYTHAMHLGDRNTYHPLSEIHSYFHKMSISFVDEMDQKSTVSLANLLSSKKMPKNALISLYSFLQRELIKGGSLHTKLDTLKRARWK